MDTVCKGCLASDRNLSIVRKEALEPMINVLQSNSHRTRRQRMDVPELLLCWECHKIIWNIRTFQKRVERAQKLLNRNVTDIENVKCMSTLTTISLVDHYDYIILENSQSLVKQEVETDTVEDTSQLDSDLIQLTNDENKPKTEINENCDDNIEDTFNDSATHCGTDVIEDFKRKFEVDFEDHNSNTSFDMTARLELSPCEDEKSFVDGLVPTTQTNTRKKGKFGTASHDNKVRRRKGIPLGPAKQGANGSYELVHSNMTLERSLYGSKYIKIVIDQKELKELRSSLVPQHHLLLKCDCGCRFGTNNALKEHVRKFHSKEAGKYICDICDKRMKTLNRMAIHCREHFLKFQCLICNKICFPRSKILKHLREHDKVFRCLICRLRLGTRQEYNNHYKEQHAFAICDYCGYKSLKKSTLERHIMSIHLEQKCKLCNTVYANKRNLDTHCRLKHSTVSAPEDAYCVECNMFFKNKLQLTSHLNLSSRHSSRKKIPCPECGNVYTKMSFMRNHFDYVHLKRTKYYCAECCKYFLSSTKLIQHNITKHGIGQRKKDKLCPHCGRGFEYKRVLTHHIRTHTGERPFQCTFCSAAFAQKYACSMHMKKQHNFQKLFSS